MPEKTLNQLVAQATDLMHEQGYYDRMIKYDVSVWRGFLEFCETNGYKQYSNSYKEEFISELRNSTPPLKESTIARKLTAMKNSTFSQPEVHGQREN